MIQQEKTVTRGLTRETILSMKPKTPNINIVDSLMGTGKSSFAIQLLIDADIEMKFIFITPFRTEIKRVLDAVKGKTERKYAEPENFGPGRDKLQSLKNLINAEMNIVSTHALFRYADAELIELLRVSNYTLIIDEAMDVVDHVPILEGDLQMLKTVNLVNVDDATGLVKWNEDKGFKSNSFSHIKALSEHDSLYLLGNTMMFWTFPKLAFTAFKEVFVLTYLFNAHQQKHYFDMFNLEYKYKSVEMQGDSYVLVDYDDRTRIDKQELRDLINIYDGRLNDIGDDNYALSKAWYQRTDNNSLVKRLQKNTYSYFRNHAKTGVKMNMWTCFKADISRMEGTGYKDGYVVVNARATNDFEEKESLAYLVNMFINPFEVQFFRKHGVVIDEDAFSLSLLLQWIWRSRIRNGEPINLYIPSKRMRNLLIDYLNSDL